MILFIGFGRLTQSLLPFIKSEETIYVFHKNRRDEDYYNQFKVQYAGPNMFSKASHIFLALPGSAYNDFFTQYGQYLHKEAIIFHMATAIMEQEVISYMQGSKVVPCKCVGQSDQMVTDKQGLLIVPESFDQEAKWLKSFFTKDMKVETGEEEKVLLINQHATKAALELAVSLKKELHKKGFDEKWIDHSLEVTVRGVIKSYCHQQLGGFGRNLLKEIEKRSEG
ncbi:MAG: hypothetical protein LPK26_11370 [Bacillaceae bacterium]|nr:hypothetical protein [Bacillaceae bacterium]